LYFSGKPPNNYQKYKQRIIDADDMQKQREANRVKGRTQYAPKIKDPSAMEVDKKAETKEA
jgi:hypothetical protein